MKTEHGTEEEYEAMAVDPDDMISMREYIPSEVFFKTTKSYTDKARADGTSYAVAYNNAIKFLMEKWRKETAEKAKEESSI